MSMTPFPHGITSFGVPVFGGGIAPTFGNVFYLVAAKASTDPYYAVMADKVPDDYIFATLASAYTNMASNQGDTLIVMPGLHTQTATLVWAKHHTRMFSFGESNRLSRYLRPNVLIYTDTAGVDYLINLTGNFCQFGGFVVSNGGAGATAGATAANLSALYLGGYGNYFKRVGFRGIQSTAQIGEATCSSLEIGQAGECEFDECIIGHNGFSGTRTSETQGHLRLTWAGAAPSPQNMIFKNTIFMSRSETAGVPMVYHNDVNNTDRMWLYDNCHFDNFKVNWVSPLCTQVFKKAVGASQTTNITLRNCSARGYSCWIPSAENPGTSVGYLFEMNMPQTYSGGGLTMRNTTDCDGTST